MRLAQLGFPTRYFALVTAIQLLSAGTIAIVTADEQSPDWISLSAKIQARSALEIIVFVCMRPPVHREVIAKLHNARKQNSNLLEFDGCRARKAPDGPFPLRLQSQISIGSHCYARDQDSALCPRPGLRGFVTGARVGQSKSHSQPTCVSFLLFMRLQPGPRVAKRYSLAACWSG